MLEENRAQVIGPLDFQDSCDIKHVLKLKLIKNISTGLYTLPSHVQRRHASSNVCKSSRNLIEREGRDSLCVQTKRSDCRREISKFHIVRSFPHIIKYEYCVNIYMHGN